MSRRSTGLATGGLAASLLEPLRDARRSVRRHRVLLAAGLAAGSVAAGLTVVAPAPPPTVAVLAAARDLVAGAVVVDADLTVVALPVALVPSGALTDPAAALGRLAAGPVRQGEPLTDVRVVGSALLERADAGTVATPVRLADPATAALLRVGDRVDVLSADADGVDDPAAGAGSAAVVAGDVEVLAVPAAIADSGEGALVVVATTPVVAARLAAAAVTGRLSVTVRR